MSEEARQNKIAYDKKYQKNRVKYRAVLNQKNRGAGTYGNMDKMDAGHNKDGTMTMEHQSKNRARNGHGKNNSRLK